MGADHVVLTKGDLTTPDPVLVRASALNPLDVLGIGGAGDLPAAMRTIAAAGRGAVILLRDTTMKMVEEGSIPPRPCASMASARRSCRRLACRGSRLSPIRRPPRDRAGRLWPDHRGHLPDRRLTMAGTAHHILPLPAFDRPVKPLIVVAPYYKTIADNLVAGARATAAKAGPKLTSSKCPARWRFRPPSPWPNAWRNSTAMSPLAASCAERPRITTPSATTAPARCPSGPAGRLHRQRHPDGRKHPPGRGPRRPRGQDKGGGAAAAALHLIALARKWGSATKGIGFRP